MSDMVDNVIKALTPFGVEWPYHEGASDAQISVNSAMASSFQRYGDLIVDAGVVLTAFACPQIVIAKSVKFGNTAAQISANALGPNGGTANAGAAGNGGEGAMAISFSGADAHAAVKLFAAAGVGGSTSGPVAPTNGSKVSALSPLHLMELIALNIGGGGGGGAGSGATGSGGNAGVRGSNGQAG